MGITRYFRGKPAPDPAPEEVKKPTPAALQGGYIQAKAEEIFEKGKGDSGLDEARKAQLDALAFVVHTVNAQDGMSARAKDIRYTYMEPPGLGFTLEVESGDAKCELNLKLFLFRYRSGPIMLERSGMLSKAEAHDFMTYDGRKFIYDLAAAYLASNKAAQRNARLRDGYFAQALEARKSPQEKAQEGAQDSARDGAQAGGAVTAAPPPRP